MKEAHCRIGKDTPLSAMDWYGGVDSDTPGVLRNTSFRVRFQFYNSGNTARAWTPRLEYSSVSSGTWTAVPTTSGTAPFFVTDTIQYTNGTAIPTANFGLGTGIGTAQNGVAYDSQNPGGAITLNANSYTEIEFNLQANANAAYYVVYLFRVTDNGTALSSYNCDARISLWEPQSTSSPHIIAGSTPDNCASCHRSHIGQGPELRKIANDKQTCMTCHDGTGTRLNLTTEFNYSYRHPIEATSGVHRAGEGYSPNWNPGTNRHVQCMDCHDPHAARTGASTPGFGDTPNNIAGDWGVIPTNPTTNWADVASTSYTRVDPVREEYQLCLKCHSSYAFGSSPPASHSGGITETNTAREFNVNNASYHFVEHDMTAAAGFTPRAAEPSRVQTFVAGSGLTSSTKINCTDCHSSANQSDPRGAHGSQNGYLLRGTWSPTEYGNCLRCHDPNTYDRTGNQTTAGKTGFAGDGYANLHSFHMAKGASEVPSCQSCHSAIPHGGQYKALLAPRAILGVVQPQDDYNRNSKLSIDTWASSGGWAQSGCSIFPSTSGGH
ncbi:MAG: cytochrome c3 family protein [Coriobacteriia bacterium]